MNAAQKPGWKIGLLASFPTTLLEEDPMILEDIKAAVDAG